MSAYITHYFATVVNHISARLSRAELVLDSLRHINKKHLQYTIKA